MPKRYKPSRRLKPKRSRLKKLLRSRLFWGSLAGLLVFSGIGYGIFFTPFLQIRHIEVQGAEKVPGEKLVEITKKHIPKKLGLFEVNNLFLANVGKVAQEVRAAFPEVETVTLDTTFPNKVQVMVKERGAVAIWCQEECFALDNNGIIFEEKEPEGEVIIENGVTGARLGSEVIASELLATILAFQKEMDSSALFKEVGLRVSTFSVASEERVNAEISEGWELYLNPKENIKWQTTKAKLVLEQEVPFAKRPSLEYIDLRFGDQAYIKYK